MNKVIVKSIYTLAFSFFALVGFTNTSDLPSEQSNLQTIETLSTIYSWAADANAVNYRIELTNSSINGITLNSTTNSVDLRGLAPGSYNVKVIAEYASGSENIIIEDAVFV